MTSQKGWHLQFREQRDQTIQHLGNTPTNRSGVDHLDRLSFEIAGQKAQSVHMRLANNVPVVVQMREGAGGGGVSTLAGSGLPFPGAARAGSGDSISAPVSAASAKGRESAVEFAAVVR